MSGIFKDGAYYPLLGGGEEMSEGEYQASLEDHDFDDVDDGLRSRREHLEALLDGPFPGEWTVRDGSTIKIDGMTTSHLDNAIRYFEREGLGGHPKINELREERKKR